MAVKLRVEPTKSFVGPFTGVTAIDTRAGGKTVKLTAFETPDKLAVMLAVPGLSPLTNPPELPDKTVAVTVVSELQVTVFVMSTKVLL